MSSGLFIDIFSTYCLFLAIFSDSIDDNCVGIIISVSKIFARSSLLSFNIVDELVGIFSKFALNSKIFFSDLIGIIVALSSIITSSSSSSIFGGNDDDNDIDVISGKIVSFSVIFTKGSSAIFLFNKDNGDADGSGDDDDDDDCL